MPVRQIDNPRGAFDQRASEGSVTYFEAQAASTAGIAAKRVVTVDANGKVALAATNANQVLCCGITLDPVPAATGGVAGTGKVATHGIVTGVPYTGTVNAGDLLTRSSASAGYVMTQAATGAGQIGQWVGYCTGVDTASGTCDVFVCKL